jgi:methylamine dehydrogenase accessory protein MauD
MTWSNIGVISHMVQWVVIIAQAVVLLALARMVGRLTRRLPPSGARVIDPGPEIGDTMDDWTGIDLLGKPVSVLFPRERGVFLLYVSPHCSTCSQLLPAAKRFFKEIGEEVEGIWVMVLGVRQTQIDYAQRNGLVSDAVLAEEQLPQSWRLGGAPFAVWIDRMGEVKAKGMADRREHLESLRNAARVGHPSFQSYVSAMAESEERRREQQVTSS